MGDISDIISTSLDSRPQFKLYTRRYFVLLVLVITQLSNAMIWISYAPIADLTASFYDTDPTNVNYLSLAFMVITAAFGFVAAYMIDHLGLRAGLITGAWLNVLGGGVKLLSAYPSILPSPYALVVAYVGQCIAALSQPFNMFAPTKLASLWFPEEHRALANTAASMANPLGIMIGSLVAPVIVHQKENLAQQFQYLLGMHCGPALLSGFLSIIVVTSSAPPTPPSASGGEEHLSFFTGVKQLFRNKMYVIIMITAGGGLALYTIFTTLLQQILCPYGYSDNFAGLCSAIMIACGLVGAAITGVFNDKYKKFEETVKTFYALAVVSGCLMCIVVRYPDQKALVAISVSAFGFFGMGFFPVCLEMAVEITYPIAEATSSAFIIICGQLQGIVFLVIMMSIAPDFDPDGTACKEGSQDFTWSNVFFVAIAFLFGVLTIMGFTADYKRLRAEQHAAAQRILTYTTSAS